MTAHLLITDHERVTEVFGRWPSFHDGEVHRLLLDSTHRAASGGRVATVELSVRGWNLAASLSDPGFYVQECDSVIEILFESVYDV
jgi:hypothetical protein